MGVRTQRSAERREAEAEAEAKAGGKAPCSMKRTLLSESAATRFQHGVNALRFSARNAMQSDAIRSDANRMKCKQMLA